MLQYYICHFSIRARVRFWYYFTRNDEDGKYGHLYYFYYKCTCACMAPQCAHSINCEPLLKRPCTHYFFLHKIIL